MMLKHGVAGYACRVGVERRGTFLAPRALPLSKQRPWPGCRVGQATPGVADHVFSAPESTLGETDYRIAVHPDAGRFGEGSPHYGRYGT